MRKRGSLVMGLACFGLASSAFGAAYTWTGSGDGTSWDDEDNWFTLLCPGTPCFPRTTSDDASVGGGSSAITVDLVHDGSSNPYEIDDLEVYSTQQSTDITFDDGDANGGAPTSLIADSARFVGGGDTHSDALKVVFTNGARIAS